MTALFSRRQTLCLGDLAACCAVGWPCPPLSLLLSTGPFVLLMKDTLPFSGPPALFVPILSSQFTCHFLGGSSDPSD